ncbi:DUF1127 domain-containing protein [Phaeovulum sp.]|uniref:DUF1127 domain-containing protein n=1 Tax=Phaeovulum sp. TaxID=2934796 RepID=UPI0039E679B3
MALVQDIRGIEHGFMNRISTFFAGLSEARQRRSVYRQTARELNLLSNRELNDLGLNRSMITRVAMEAAYGK